jgi:hypothetical protein
MRAALSGRVCRERPRALGASVHIHPRIWNGFPHWTPGLVSDLKITFAAFAPPSFAARDESWGAVVNGRTECS